jgi:K+/H+ antiporter YhaU regulatory subunit KhtT
LASFGLWLWGSAPSASYSHSVIAVKKASGQMIFNPQPQTVIHEGDTLVVLGNKENLEQLEALPQ